MTEQAKTVVNGLLPGWAGGDLAETCSWADRQRFRYRWSSPLHFADNPGDCKFDYASKLLPDSDQHCFMQSCCFRIQSVRSHQIVSLVLPCHETSRDPTSLKEKR